MIGRFTGPHRFLSNFHPCEVLFDGEAYPTVEHAYQAAKCARRRERAPIRRLRSPLAAKRAGRRVALRAGWEAVKVEVMADLLRQKFADPELAAKLLATGQAELVEGNDWGDRYWGSVDGHGRNMLGELLMELRAELSRASAGR